MSAVGGMVPRLRMLKAGLLAVGLLLVAAPAAWASTFTVDNTGDDNGTGACTALGAADCSLRSAITNANTAGADAIDFAPAVSDGTVANSTILLDVGANGALPSIGADTTLDGGNCGTATAARPCVGLDGGGTGGAALHISAVNVTVRGLAISNAGTGVLIDSATDNVKGNWFGIKLDGTTEAALFNGVALLDDSADGNTIGGTTAPDRNVFSRTTGAAVQMGAG